MKIKIISSQNCPSCNALKGYLKGSLKSEQFNSIEMINADDFWYDKLRAMGVSKLPVVVLESAEDKAYYYQFTDLLQTSELIKKYL